MAALPALAGNARVTEYEPVVLGDESGRPLKAASLKPQVNYVFHYPYVATPVFLLRLGRTVPGQAVRGPSGSYDWPGGIGPDRSIVAFSAICAHKLVYPNKDVSFISFRKGRARRGVQDGLIHCCAENSQYDPAAGARVVSGPAEQPLAAVLLRHDAREDTLTAYGTVGPELFKQFFEKYAAKLALDVGPQAVLPVSANARVMELERFCRNPVSC
ncbi:(2Fe-2S)-binding protein [Ramlibacter rhizophilus]|uniref:(2Fe-2S)-binding protein n=1 Tax=Ramlibacter rhizophilus TaxID=1781167 RepID=A0A4Z0BYX5_9BURK|nr:(2Fe-2S)-binding protein [Ramlibacter rhizophilus]